MKMKEMCKVTWCNRQDRFYKNGRKKTYCSVHVNRPGNASSRPHLFYKTERIVEGKLECEHCGDNYPKKYSGVDIKLLEGSMDVDHIKKPTEWDIKNNPWYDPKTGKIEHPDNYQLLCRMCHIIKSHKEGDYIPKKYR